ncbi:MAG: DEAD/DEAH box helicase family protein [Clostridia bacterium]|nr:DEAD/DEAH box helicase family protein [Clostridia bacterium]
MIEKCIGKNEWVSDVIGDDFKKWRTKDKSSNFGSYPTKVFIEAPTGSGKTYFIINKLLPFAAEQGRNILYLGNRTVLEKQVKKHIGSVYYETYDENKEITKFDIFFTQNKIASITVMNYQAIIGALKKGLPAHISGKYYYVIFDEVHFFLEDALFNPMTFYCYDTLFRNFYDSVKIFISATIKETKTLIDSLKPEDYREERLGIEKNLIREDIKTYFVNSNVKKYVPYYFKEEAEILEAIKRNLFKDKWLIFVHSKQYGKQLQTKIESIISVLYSNIRDEIHTHKRMMEKKLNREEIIKEKRNIAKLEEEEKRIRKCKVAFVNADNKYNKTMSNIINNSKYNETILITTKVLDNGVNIKDTAVKHIVIPFSYRVEFLQMLGRKRIENNEVVNLYVQYPSSSDIYSKSKYIKRLFEKFNKVNELVERFEHLYEYRINNQISQQIDSEFKKANEQMTAIMQDFWNEDKSVQNLFYIDKYRNLRCNPFSTFQLIILENFYTNLDNDFKNIGYTAVNQKIEKWLGKQLVCSPIYLQEKLYGTMDDWIVNNLNKAISPADQAEFYEKYMIIFNIWLAKNFANAPEKLREWYSVKKGKDRRKAAICKSLQIAELPYTLVKRDGSWVLIDISN